MCHSLHSQGGGNKLYNILCPGACLTIKNTGSLHKETTLKLCSHVWIIKMHVCINICISKIQIANVDKKCAVQKQCMQQHASVKIISKMSENYVHTHVSKCLHVTYILSHACIWAKYMVCACKQKLYAIYTRSCLQAACFNFVKVMNNLQIP